MSLLPRLLLPILLSIFLYSSLPAAPQEGGKAAMIKVIGGSKNMSKEQREAFEKMKSRGSRGSKEKEKPEGEGKDKKPEGDKEKSGDEKEKDGEEEKPTSVKRPDTPKKPADPKELEATPEDDGGMILKFHGHPWPAMIEWYSMASGREIEWRELPTGYVKLRTTRKYSMEETADLLNRLLLALGYTILDDGELMTVEKTEAINPALVPRVKPNALGTLMPHSFVRTSFRLTRVKADEVVTELETLKSKNGKLTAMSGANRIEAMDSVSNLLDIYQAVDEEESSGRHAPQEFILKHVKAEIVRGKLEEMLGLKKKEAPLSREQQEQLKRRREEMARRGQKQPETKEKEKTENISFVVNEVNNSIIAKAPAHKMVDIAETIQYLDIPSARGGLDSYVDRIKTYRFATLDPAEVKNILEETAGLDPSTTITVDAESKSLIASAPPWDHMVIQKLTEKLDGSLRAFKVIQLRRLRALQVATTIESMMGEPKEENSRSRRYNWWDDRGKDDDKSDKFRVGADTEYNRLLLKCNDTEYQTVTSLLEQLGEVKSRDQVASRTRVLQAAAGEGQDAFLQRVQRAFKAMGMDNEIVLPPALPKEEPTVEDDDAEAEADQAPSRAAVTMRSKSDAPTYRTLYTQERVQAGLDAGANTVLTATPTERAGSVANAAPTSNTAPTQKASPTSKAPILIERDADGNLVLRSADTAALDALEQLMREMAPPAEDWVHFKMRNVTAYWMKMQLEDFFQDEDDEKPWFVWDWDDDDDSPAGLGDEPKLKFIDDGESTLVVRNATPKQMATVKRLIELYDVSEPPNEQNARFKKMIHIKHSKARTIENALKEAFRDLLSSNDKAFGQPKGEGEKEGGSRRFGFYGFSQPETGIGGSAFKGKLSFGVDETTNVLIVTAEGKQLLEVVEDMVAELDTAAVVNDETRVVDMEGRIASGTLQATLTRMFGAESVVTKPQGEQGEGGDKGKGGGDRGGERGGQRRGGRGGR